MKSFLVVGPNALGVLLLAVSLLPAQENPGASPFRPPPDKFGGSDKASMTDALEDAHAYIEAVRGWSIQRQNFINSDGRATGNVFTPRDPKDSGNLGEGPMATVIKLFQSKLGKDISNKSVAASLTDADAGVVKQYLGWWKAEANEEAKKLYETSATLLQKKRRQTELLNNYKSENADEINKLTEEMEGLQERYEARRKNLSNAIDKIRITHTFLTAGEAKIVITTPADAAEVQADAVTVTGTIEGSTADSVSIQVNGKDFTVPVRNKAFSISVPLAEGKNVLQAIAAKSRSASIIVTRSTTLIVTFDGTWAGEITAVSSDNGVKAKPLQFPVKFRLTQKGNDLEMTYLESSGKAVPGSYKAVLQAPQIAMISIKVEPVTMETYRKSGFVNRTYISLREGKLHWDQSLDYTYSALDSQSKTWVSHVVKDSIHGTLTRAP